MFGMISFIPSIRFHGLLCSAGFVSLRHVIQRSTCSALFLLTFLAFSVWVCFSIHCLLFSSLAPLLSVRYLRIGRRNRVRELIIRKLGACSVR
ncbi:hypothetical protein BJX70DRAFT_252120 [Aspergillus crustosus]